jgi:uncharacterized SAM-binding protein YcdF (DUF218 family)
MQTPASSSKKRPRSAWWIVVAVLAALLAAVYLCRAPLLTGLAQALIVDSQPLEPADLIFVLNGDYNTRPFRAAELYRQGLAPLILIARSEETPTTELGLVPNETDIAVRVMEQEGVPPERILVLPVAGGVTSTFDEAVALRHYLEVGGQGRVLLVTSAFHSRRALWIFRRELAGLPVRLEMAAVPYLHFDQTNWWRNENGLITLNNEYIKLFYYFVTYR